MLSEFPSAEPPSSPPKVRLRVGVLLVLAHVALQFLRQLRARVVEEPRAGGNLATWASPEALTRRNCLGCDASTSMASVIVARCCGVRALLSRCWGVAADATCISERWRSAKLSNLTNYRRSVRSAAPQ